VVVLTAALNAFLHELSTDIGQKTSG
jgi:hypothetical protein